MEHTNTTSDLYFAAALFRLGHELDDIFRVGKRVNFRFKKDISKEFLEFTNDTLMVPAKSYGNDIKYLKAQMGELYQG